MFNIDNSYLQKTQTRVLTVFTMLITILQNNKLNLR